jgi:hypothetical protein
MVDGADPRFTPTNQTLLQRAARPHRFPLQVSQLHDLGNSFVDVDLVAAAEGKPRHRGPGRAGHLLHTGDFIQIDGPGCVGRNVGQFNHFHG